MAGVRSRGRVWEAVLSALLKFWNVNKREPEHWLCMMSLCRGSGTGSMKLEDIGMSDNYLVPAADWGRIGRTAQSKLQSIT